MHPENGTCPFCTAASLSSLYTLPVAPWAWEQLCRCFEQLRREHFPVWTFRLNFAGHDTSGHTMAWTLCAPSSFRACEAARTTRSAIICLSAPLPVMRKATVWHWTGTVKYTAESHSPPLIWRRFHIATHPEVETKMTAELASKGLLVTPDNQHPRKLAYEDLAGLTYLGAAIKVNTYISVYCRLHVAYCIFS